MLFQTLESFVSLRDEAAAFFILDRKVEEIIPTNSRWLYNLQKMMTVFFLGEKRTPIRAKVNSTQTRTFFLNIHQSQICFLIFSKVDTNFVLFLLTVFLLGLCNFEKCV